MTFFRHTWWLPAISGMSPVVGSHCSFILSQPPKDTVQNTSDEVDGMPPEIHDEVSDAVAEPVLKPSEASLRRPSAGVLFEISVMKRCFQLHVERLTFSFAFCETKIKVLVIMNREYFKFNFWLHRWSRV